MRNHVEEKFLEFYDNWVIQLEQYLHQLLVAHNNYTMSEIELRALISKLTTHHKAYYTAKWAAIGEDVLAFFGPVWLNPLEKACFWLTGWKPSTVFRMVDRLRKSKVVLVEAQVKKLEELRVKTKFEEQKIEREMERYQVVMADRKMVELARLGCHVGGESVVVVEAAVKGLSMGLEKMVKAADCVRLKTLKGILDILAPPQCVEFWQRRLHFRFSYVGGETTDIMSLTPMVTDTYVRVVSSFAMLVFFIFTKGMGKF